MMFIYTYYCAFCDLFFTVKHPDGDGAHTDECRFCGGYDVQMEAIEEEQL
jgi:hypothetical protein